MSERSRFGELVDARPALIRSLLERSEAAGLIIDHLMNPGRGSVDPNRDHAVRAAGYLHDTSREAAVSFVSLLSAVEEHLPRELADRVYDRMRDHAKRLHDDYLVAAEGGAASA
jgi:hypothetical protein